MNFEQLFYKIIRNPHLLRDKKKTLIFIKYHFHLLAVKRRKLKLGKIVFEIKEYRLDEMPAYKEEVEIRYVRQDTLDQDELKLENRLKALAWKWDFSHVAAWIIVNSIAVGIIYVYIYWWYCDTFPALAFKPKKYDQLVKCSIDTVLGQRTLLKVNFANLSEFNLWLADITSKLAIKADVFF